MTRNLNIDNYFLLYLQYKLQTYLLIIIAKKLFPYFTKCKKLFLKLSIIFQIFNYICDNIGILGDLTYMTSIPAITLGILAIILGVPAITAGVLPSRALFYILNLL